MAPFYKLPDEIKKHLTRENNSAEWTLDTLMANILREFRVFEISFHNVGDSSFPASNEPLPATASFHTGTCGQSNRTTERKKTACVFCKGAHFPNACNIITKLEERMSLIKENHLCFNCLVHHKVPNIIQNSGAESVHVSIIPACVQPSLQQGKHKANLRLNQQRMN